MSDDVPYRPDDVVWRESDLVRWGAAASALIGGLIITAAAVISPSVWWLALFDLVLLVFAWTRLRPKVALRGDTLHVVGRFTSKDVPLRRVTQVAQGVGDLLWLRARASDDPGGAEVVVPLRPIGQVQFAQEGGPAGAGAVALLRARAERAGAQLEPALPGPTPVPPGWHVVFGA